MDRELTRPRRIAIALSIALLAGGIPFVVASGAGSETVLELPASWQTAAPGNGDEGTYNLTRFAGAQVITPSTFGFGFQHNFHVLPVDGIQMVEEISEARGWGCNLNNQFRMGYQGDLRVAGQLVGTSKSCDMSDDPVYEEAPGWGGRKLVMQDSEFDFTPDGYSRVYSCIHSHVFQGAEVALAQVPTLDQVTRLSNDGPGCWMGGATTWRAAVVATATSGDEDALIVEFHVAHSGHEIIMQWTLVESLAYPVRMEAWVPAGADPRFHPWEYEVDSRPTRWVYELVSFNPGGSLPDVKAAKLPPWTTQAWTATGPKEDVALLFSIQDAINVLETEDGFEEYRSFMAANPGAVLQSAAPDLEDDGDGSRMRSWSFKVGDAGASFEGRVIMNQFRATHGAVGHHSGLDGPWLDPTYQFGGVSSSRMTVDPQDLPRVPAVSTMFATYQALTGQPANSWEFAQWNDGDGMVLYVGVAEGSKISRWQDDDLFFGSGQEKSFSWDYLAFAPDGRLVGRDAHSMEDSYGPQVPTQSPERSVNFDVTEQPANVRTITGGQAAVVAGTGAAGILVALTYWLWPVLKTGPLAMFSRVNNRAVLENPTRGRIMEAIESEPGVHLMDLTRRAGVGPSAVRHHVSKLQQAGLVRVQRQGKYVCHFAANVRTSQAGIVRSAGAQKVLQALEQGVSSPADIAKRTHLAVSTVHYHLGRLSEAGLVDAQQGAYSVAA